MAIRESIQMAVLTVGLVGSAALVSAQTPVCSPLPTIPPNFSTDFSTSPQCISLNGNGANSSVFPVIGTSPLNGGQPANVLRLTDNEGGWATSAWYQAPQVVTSGFSTTFAFQIGGTSTYTADGIAFLVQNSPAGLNALGSSGGGIGYAGIPNSLAIEFNTYYNAGSDPNANDVTIQSCGTSPNAVDPTCAIATNNLTGTGITLSNGSVHVATVVYSVPPTCNTAPCSTLDVILDGTDLFPGGVPFDITTLYPANANTSTAFVGFTAGTGGGNDEQDIANWIFVPTVTQSQSAPVSGTTQTTFPVNGGFAAGGFDLTATQTSNAQTVQMNITTIPLTQQACNALVQKNPKFKNAQCFVYQNGSSQNQDSSVLFEVTCPANAQSSCAANSAFFADLGSDFSFNCAENAPLVCPPNSTPQLPGGSFGLGPDPTSPHLTSVDGLPSIGLLKGEGPDSAHPCTAYSDGVTPLFASNQVESFSLGDTSGGAKGGSGGTTSCWVVTYNTQNETPTATVTAPVQSGTYTQNTASPNANSKYACSAVSAGDPNSPLYPTGPYLGIPQPTPVTPVTCGATDSPGGAVISGDPFDTATLGQHTFTANVQDSAMNSSQTVVMYNVVAPPTVSGPASAIFTVGTFGSVTFNATGYQPSLSEAGAVLPAGVTFVDNGNGTATLSGTPTAAGTFVITVTAHNTTTAPGPTASLQFTLTSAASVPASGTKCNGIYDGTFKGNLTVSAGQTCIFVGGGVTGNVAVNGGSLTLSDATVTGNFQAVGGTFAISSGTSMKGNFAVLDLSQSSVQNTICGSGISGNLQVVASFTPIAIGNGTASCPGNIIGGSLTVTANAAPTAIYGNTVGGSLTDSANLKPTQVFSNTIKSSLSCTADVSITGGGNTAAVKSGQCAKF